MRVRVNWGIKNTNAKYKLAAKTLDAVRKELEARDEWGDFKGGFTDSSGRVDVDGSGAVQKITLTPWYRITMPRWPAYRQQRQSVKDLWDPMWTALKKHEEGHLEIHMRGFNRLKDTLEALPEATAADVSRLLEDASGKSQAEQDEYDRKTEHGAAAGVEL